MSDGPRSIPCECCYIDVQLTRKRLKALAKSGGLPLCSQCCKYVAHGTARMSEPVGETQDIALVLTRKRGKRAKRVDVLESMPLRRCGSSGSTSQGFPSEVRDK